MLFDDQPRSDARPATAESVFEFLARAAGEYWEAVRHELNAWFARYRAEERAKLRRRLFDDDHAQPAFWELLLHELYTAAGFSVELEPPLEDTSHRPDFRISDDESAFLLEARAVTATTPERRARNRRLQTLIEAINQVRPDNFYVQFDVVSEGRRQPAAQPVLARLVPWLAQQDPETIAQTQRTQGLRALPSIEIPTGDWVLRFRPVGVDPRKRGRLTGPLIGIGPMETSISDPTAAIRKRLSHKGRRYGTARLPLILALDLEEMGIETGDVAAALFGKVAAVVAVDGERGVVGQRRLDDGYWSARRRAGQRVAAVLTVRTPRPWNLTTLEPQVWLNPWAPTPYTGRRLWQWTTVDRDTGEFQQGPAETTVAELLGLPADWPPGAPFENDTCRS